MPDKEVIWKLRRTGLSQRVAGKLVRAGYRSPRLIKAATDAELLAIPSIKGKDVGDVRAKIG